MNAKQFQRYLVRDGGCVHCGELDAIAPHHRRNRGIGGSKKLDIPSNIIVMCSLVNFLMESDPKWAQQAREKGWKLRHGETPNESALWHFTRGWILLDDEFKWKPAEQGGMLDGF